MRFSLLAVLTSWALLFIPPAQGAVSEGEAQRFLREALGQEGLHSFDPDKRRKLLSYAKALLSSPPGQPPFTRCFAPDTPLDFLSAHHQLEEAAAAREPDPNAPQAATQLNSRWSQTATNGSGQGAQGLPITLTWSIVPDGTDIPGDSGIGDADGPSNLRTFLAGLFGGSETGPPHEQAYFIHLSTVFDNIAAKTGISYVYEENDDGAELKASNRGVLGVRGDIRIGGHDIDGNSFTLGYNFYPNNGDMVIDTSDDWFSDNRSNFNAFTNLVEHEHGHGLGLDHVCPNNSTKIMEPLIRTTFRGIRFDDIYSLHRHYGDFHEKHGAARNNDSIANATPLTLNNETAFGVEWLSIDDNSDVDYYTLDLLPGSMVTIRVIPSNEIYPEGPQSQSCSAGKLFDSTDIHDLTLDLIAPDQITTLISGPGTPAGQSEFISNYVTTQPGIHYIRINGDNSDSCQLYRLEIEITNPPVALTLTMSALADESFTGRNEAPDPGETLRYSLTLTNTGSLSASNIQGTLTGPTGFTGFTTTQNFGTLHGGDTATGSFIFALEGHCGDAINLSLDVTADPGYARSFPISLTLGTVATVLSESADASADLSPGWSSSTTGSGTGWRTTNARVTSPPRSFFTDNPDRSGSSSLQTPALTLGNGESTLSFSHFYVTEPNSDGGVLEISIADGPWQDFLAAGGSFASNGYDSTLDAGSSNPLAGRPAWSGDPGRFVLTTAILPSAATSQSVRLRWTIGHDNSTGATGWFVDDIALNTPTCDSSPPALTLSSSDTSADEFFSLDTASITLTTALPSLQAIPAILLNTGSADLALDVSDLSKLQLPPGQTSQSFPITALSDGLHEGPESLNLSLLAGHGSALISIVDTPYSQWAFTQLGTGPLTGPYEDFDHDGLSNIEEYTRRTDPSSQTPFPSLNPSIVGDDLQIEAPLAQLPPDVSLRAETSEDLVLWTTNGVQILPNGFQIPLGDPARFLQLSFESLLTAP